jgi:PKD repeat protein
MNTRYTLLFALAAGLVACKKDTGVGPPTPVASFSVAGMPDADVITVGTYDDIQVNGKAANAVSYQWNLGNDSTRTTRNPRFSYSKAGTYSLTLTVKNATGQQASVSKKVRVLNRVIRKVAVVDVSDRVSSPPHNNLTNAVMWVVIRLGEDNVSYPYQSVANPSFAAPIIYQSPAVPMPAATSLPYTFTLPTGLVVNLPALLSYPSSPAKKGQYKGVGYGLELYAKDAAGTYLLSSSYLPFYQSQAGSINGVGTDIQKNTFTARYGAIQLLGDFE